VQTGQLVANILVKQRYRIIGLVGSGGMGAVYKAEDTQLGNRLVALKEMRQGGMNAQELQQAADAFRQEATMLARLQHPNLPSIFDHFEEHGRWYLVMSFLEGETLKDYLSRHPMGKLSLNEALQIGIQLCTVLGYLHQQRPAPIVFRDLKPANIMRTSDGHIYLIDFGIARHFKPDQTRDTAHYGSAGYAPPEQYGQAQTTPRSDVYSLGVVLHQMLSGYNPSAAPFQFPPLRTRFAAIPIELEALITQMLNLDQNKRPPDVLVVRQILQKLVTAPDQSASRLPPMAAARPPISPPGKIPPPVAVGKPPVSPAGKYWPAPAAGRAPVLPPRRSGKKLGWIVLLVGIVGIVIAASGAIFYISSLSLFGGLLTPTYPHLASSYQGSMHNTTIGTTATLTLTSIMQNQQIISGTMTLGPGLQGSGTFTGTVGLDNSIQFTVTSDDGSNAILNLTGFIHSQNTLSGTYSGSNIDVSGLVQMQTGTWEASANSAHTDSLLWAFGENKVTWDEARRDRPAGSNPFVLR